MAWRFFFPSTEDNIEDAVAWTLKVEATALAELGLILKISVTSIIFQPQNKHS